MAWRSTKDIAFQKQNAIDYMLIKEYISMTVIADFCMCEKKEKKRLKYIYFILL